MWLPKRVYGLTDSILAFLRIMWNRNANLLITKNKENCLLTSWFYLENLLLVGYGYELKTKQGDLESRGHWIILGAFFSRNGPICCSRTFSLSRRYRPFKIMILYLWDESTKQWQMNSFTLFWKKKSSPRELFTLYIRHRAAVIWTRSTLHLPAGLEACLVCDIWANPNVKVLISVYLSPANSNYSRDRSALSPITK